MSKFAACMGKIRYASFSEAGVRRDNEDYCKVVTDPENDRYLFVVCDGMGGHAMGEVASQVVCEAICNYWQQSLFDNDIENVLKEAFKEASKALDAKADVLKHVEMGTTMVLAAIDGNHLTIAHAGDSRAYLLQNGKALFSPKTMLTIVYGEISSTVASSLIKETRPMWRCTSLSWNQVTGFFFVLMAFASL